MSRNSSLVYSTESGRMCPDCAKPVAQCQCKKRNIITPTDGIVRLRRETKGRNGKGVTLIEGLGLDEENLNRFAKTLKNKCGSGGTVKEGIIEIQGDHRQFLYNFLQESGYKVKLAGG
jgi:translation initiation factor 1